MEENEGKDLAQERKIEVIKEKAYQDFKLELNKIQLDTMIVERQIRMLDENGNSREATVYDIYMKFKGDNVLIGSMDEQGKITPNRDILNDERYTEEEREELGNMLNLFGLNADQQVDIKEFQEKLKEHEKELEHRESEKQKEDDETIKDEVEQEEKEIEEDSEEIEDNDDKEKQELARKYDVSAKDIVHLNTSSKKITENEAFSGLVKWAEGRDNIYVIADKKGSIKNVLEKKDDQYEEVEQDMKQIQGNYPNTTIHLVGDDKVTKVVPLKLYQIDSKQALATVRNEWGELETVYCRKQEGKEEYFGEKVPEEHSGKNVRQLGFEERSFMDSKNTSSRDLAKKAEEFSIADDHDNRGVPSDEKGVQIEEIDGTSEQNRKNEKEKIKEDLYKRMGITEKTKATLMPGQLEYIEAKIDKEADKIQLLMSENKDINYEQAVEQVEAEEGEREERRNDTRR